MGTHKAWYGVRDPVPEGYREHMDTCTYDKEGLKGDTAYIRGHGMDIKEHVQRYQPKRGSKRGLFRGPRI